jgi:LysM repeat protein
MNLIKRTTLFLMAITISIGLISTAYQPVTAAVVEPQNCTRWHTVQRGEYLAIIANQYDTSWRTLVEINGLKDPSLVFSGQKLCIFLSGTSSNPPTNVTTNSSSASVFASSVKEDQSVTIQGKNLSANSRYSVYLGKYKADPVYKILVGSVITDKNGSFKGTYKIPKKLYDVLKIRISATNQRGVSTSNWFINATSSGYTGGISSPELSLAIQSVKKGVRVKIVTTNLPTNVSFNVYMKKDGAPQQKAVIVGKLRAPKGGSVVATFDIPDSIQDRPKLEIFAVNNALGMMAEAIFDNKTTK